MGGKPVMIEAALAPIAQIRRSYDAKSRYYARLVAPLERKPRLLGLELAATQPRDRVLEVAVGPGMTLVEMARRVSPDNVVQGVDLSPGMLAQARRLAREAGVANVALQEADARHLPFPDAAFDVLYNSYMLDLIPLADMPVILAEFHRVLKPGGRLVLVNLSKRAGDQLTWFERLYAALPARWAPALLGNCRPVVMAPQVAAAGFTAVTREFVPNIMPSEVVTARKPSA